MARNKILTVTVPTLLQRIEEAIKTTPLPAEVWHSICLGICPEEFAEKKIPIPSVHHPRSEEHFKILLQRQQNGQSLFHPKDQGQQNTCRGIQPPPKSYYTISDNDVYPESVHEDS